MFLYSFTMSIRNKHLSIIFYTNLIKQIVHPVGIQLFKYIIQ